MRASRLLTLVMLVPAAALAQAAALEQARQAGAVQQAGTDAHQRAADAQGEEAKATSAPREEPAAPGEQPGIDLGNAAAQLQNEPDQATTPAPGNAPAAPAPDAYTVKPGDTLWDLSGRFLNNPWYWPKVWSYNPEITNPHFIYPGNVVRFAGGTEEGPTRLEPVQQVAGGPAPADDEDLAAPRELEDFTRADMKKPQQIGEADDVTVVGPYKIGYVPPKGVYARHDSFVTKRELEESGTITASFEEKLMLSVQDRAYAGFAQPAKVKPGESYILYKTERAVTHPVTGALFGYQSTIIGSAKVVAVDDKAATIEIVQAFEPIERGALIGPWTDKLLKQVQRRPNQRALDGFIIAAQENLVSEIGEHHMVFVDKGRADGVEEGNVFTVIRSGDPYGREMNEIMLDRHLPKEDVGTLLVVDAQQTSSAALVVRSLRELYVGDKVEMRSASSGSGGN
jgi:LysM repeat protein